MPDNLVKSKELKVALEAALEAGKILERHLETDIIKSMKHDKSISVLADGESEEMIKKIIFEAFPEHSILGEETGMTGQESDYVWHVDPLDGTRNFAHGVPFFCVAIALEYKGELRVGVVYNPATRSLFYAEKNKGTYLNDKRIFVSKDGEVHSMITVSRGKKPSDEKLFRELMHDLPIHNSVSIGDLGWEDIDFELDLMVSDAVQNFDVYTKLGPKRIIFHLEAVGIVEEFQHFLEGIDNYIRDSIQIGVAISPNTVTTKIFPLINYIDFVQVMGIDHEGMQGEEFDEKCLEHIKTLKEKFPDLIISVDGGVNFETAEEILDAGADRLVIGSAIFNTDDIIGTIENFRQI